MDTAALAALGTLAVFAIGTAIMLIFMPRAPKPERSTTLPDIKIGPNDKLIVWMERYPADAEQMRAIQAHWAGFLTSNTSRVVMLARNGGLQLQILRQQPDDGYNGPNNEFPLGTQKGADGAARSGNQRALDDAGEERQIAAEVGRDVPAAPPVTNSLEEPHGRIIAQPGGAA